MSYLLPSSMQKRLLRYALSRVELVDTDALDLESLDIAWSKRSTVELKDVGLRINKLRSLLHIPEQVELKSARISRLSITVPADIYSSSIVVKIEGIHAHLYLPLQQRSSTNQSDRNEGITREKWQRREYQSRSRLRSPPPGSLEREVSSDRYQDDHIPSARDLAMSFLQEEPTEERRELEAVISSRSQVLNQSVSSTTGSDEDANIGLGTGLTLPGFLANFFRGVADRLKVQVVNTTFNIDVVMDRDDGASESLSSSPPIITLKLSISNLDVHPVDVSTVSETPSTEDPLKSTSSKPEERKLHLGKRCISLRNIQGCLIWDHSLTASSFGAFDKRPKRNGTPPDSPILRRSYKNQDSSTAEHSLPVDHNDEQYYHSVARVDTDPELLQGSMLSSEGGKFADAAEDDSYKSFIGLEQDHSQNAALETSENLDIEIPLENKEISTLLSESDDLEYSDTFHLNMRQSLQAFREERRKSAPLGHIKDAAKISPFDTRNLKEIQRWRAENEEVFGGDETPTKFENHLPESLDNQISPNLGSVDEIDSLLESREFSHQEARSLYMSAMSEQLAMSFSSDTPPQEWIEEPNISEHQFTNPSAEASVQVRGHEGISSPRSFVLEHEKPKGVALDHTISIEEAAPQSLESMDINPAMPPLSTTLHSSPIISDHTNFLACQILFVDRIDIWIPSVMAASKPNQNGLEEEGSQMVAESGLMSQSECRTVPGAFSQYADRSRVGNRKARPFDADVSHVTHIPKLPPDENNCEIELIFGSFQLRADILSSQALKQLIQQLIVGLGNSASSPKPKDSPAHQLKIGNYHRLKLEIRQFSIKFFENLQTGSEIGSRNFFGSNKSWSSEGTGADSPLFETIARDIKIQAKSSVASLTAKLDVARFTFGFPDGHIISFSKDASMRTSVRDLQERQSGNDITISVKCSEDILELDIFTLPVKLDLDVQKLDGTLSCFGGFSGLFELGSSITSTGPAAARNQSNLTRLRTVRFDAPDETNQSETANRSFKIQSRIGGAYITLRGKECYLIYQSTAIKVVGRDTLIGMRVDHAQIKGPYSPAHRTHSPIPLQLHDILLKFLVLPEEQDLTKLLSLITPSKDKFEEDDDILVGTLLQQRKKGSVLRATISKVDLLIQDLNDVNMLHDLATELAKLSSVTKYLPEDERPGLMTLGSIGQLRIRVDVSEEIGSFDLEIENAEIGHVGLPPLLALSVNKANAHRNGDQKILRQVLVQQKMDSPPMIMARVIGDEMEPTVKIKLYNICVEYSVPLVVAILNLSLASHIEDRVIDLANSIAQLTQSPSTSQANTQLAASHTGQKLNPTPLVLDIALRDCAVGLTPQGIPAKGMLLLTDVHIAGALPNDAKIDVVLAIRKASYLMINDVSNIVSNNPTIPAVRITQHPLESLQSVELCRQGFVLIASLSAAKLLFKQVRDPTRNTNLIEIDFRDALLVLETCADSTETISKIFEGLSLPSPPASGQAYRAEAGPIEDLMASVLFDAFGTDQADQKPDDESRDFADISNQEDEDYDEGELAVDSDVMNAFVRAHAGQTLDPLMDSILFNRSQMQLPGLTTESTSYQTHVGLDAVETFKIVNSHGTIDNFRIQPITTSYGGTAHKWSSVQNKYMPVETSEILECPMKVRIRGLHVIWNLFDGYDWEKTRDTIAEAVKGIESKAAERRANRRRSLHDEYDDESVIGDFLFNSIYIGIPTHRDDQDLRRRINADMDDIESETGSYASSMTTRPQSSAQPKRQKLKLARSKRHKITFELRGVSADVYVFKPGEENQSSIDISVTDVEVFDHVPTSTWKKFATYMHDAGIREDDKPMIHLEICTVRPVPELTASELVVKVSILPLRLHVDQDALDFITRFFEFSDTKPDSAPSSNNEPYLQRVEVEAVLLKLDYKPKKVDYAGLRSGHTTEFMNFFILDGADILLKHAIVYGVRGFTRLHKDLDGVWMPDIKRNQLPGILSGLTGLRSLVDVGIGIRDMVEIPIQEYRKDGRILKSIQKGAAAFGKTTSELTRLGAKLATGAQTTLQGAEDLLVRPDPYNDSGWEVTDLEEGEKQATSNYADQPTGIMQGLKGAADGLRREVLLTRDTIVAMSSGIRESTSATGAAGAIAKHAPTIIFRPVIGASKAVSQTLMGATNSLDPESKRRLEDKYKKY